MQNLKKIYVSVIYVFLTLNYVAQIIESALYIISINLSMTLFKTNKQGKNTH